MKIANRFAVATITIAAFAALLVTTHGQVVAQQLPTVLSMI